MSATAPMRAELIDVMSGMPRIQRAPDLQSLFETGVRRFFVRDDDATFPVRVGGQVDLTAHAIVHDGELGTLGLIHFITSHPNADWIRQRIDEAAYLRHLLVEELRPGTTAADSIPYSVEVVFAVSFADANALREIGEMLRTILRESSYLHAIGINLWRGADPGAPADGSAHRAFSWLLAQSEKWFFEVAAPVAAASSPLKKLRLANIRTLGTRELSLEPTQQLHIVHGHNGSGKSSLSEALELVMTGAVQRLRDQDYTLCLQNRDARQRTESAAVTLTFEDGRMPSWTIQAQGVDNHLNVANADSFRMDQDLADRLGHGTPGERATLFLTAFFGSENAALQSRRNAATNARDKFEQLPDRLKKLLGSRGTDSAPYELDAARAEKELMWLSDSTLTWERFIDLLPLTKEQIGTLESILPREVTERYSRTGATSRSEIDSAAKALDDAFQAFAFDLDAKLRAVEQSVTVLQTYGDATVSTGARETEQLEILLQRWQELHALTDLFEREDQIASAIQDARGRGYAFDSRIRPALAVEPPTLSLNERRDLITQLKADRDDLRRRVTSFTATAEAVRADVQTDPRTLQPEALTSAATMGVFGEQWKQAAPPLGQAVSEAFGQQHPVEVRSAGSVLARVGEAAWGREFLDQATRILDGLRVVAAARTELPNATRPLANLLNVLEQLRNESATITRLDKDAVQKLDEHLAREGQLRRALNELTALFTPARWAYTDVVPQADLKGNEQNLELQAEGFGNVSARFLLNTAELNTLALATFLLCARRVENPLHLLVLDDPLQNMDELTVTTIARGLGHLLQLWKRLDGNGPKWRILLLIHGEDDMERIRSEVPCIAHFLPWLSPGDGPQDPAIPTRRSRLSEKLQTLSGTLAAPA